MTPEEIAANEAATAAAKVEADARAKAEAEKNLHNNRTEKEKAEFSLKKNAERLKALGGDPSALLGVTKPLDDEDEIDDNTPVTFGKLKELQKREGTKSALQMADSIQDEQERNEVKTLLSTRITSSGNAEADLALARNAVNSEKNRQMAEEANRRTRPTRTAAGGSAPGKTEDRFEPTAEEALFMQAPYNVPKAKILEARTLAEARLSR